MGNVIKLKIVTDSLAKRFCYTCGGSEKITDVRGNAAFLLCWDLLLAVDPDGRCDEWHSGVVFAPRKTV